MIAGKRSHWNNVKMLLMATTFMALMMIYYNNDLTHLVSQYSYQRPMLMDELHHRMKERVEIIKKTCHKYSNEQLYSESGLFKAPQADWSKFSASLLPNTMVLLNRKDQLAWCKVPKIASTSIALGILQLRETDPLVLNSRTPKIHNMLVRLMPHKQSNENISNYTSFMVARHPFQRILSAYRDKLCDRSYEKKFERFKKTFGLPIIKKHRTSQQPLQYMDIPTFGEFAKYLISTPVRNYNPHWFPYNLICTPCHHNYTIILHLETLADDLYYLAKVTGLQEFKVPHLHAAKSDFNAFSQTKEKQISMNSKKEEKHHIDASKQDENYSKLMEVNNDLIDSPNPNNNGKFQVANTQQEIDAHFYSQISYQNLIKLYNIYKIDFEMFGYSLSPYDTYVFN